MHQKWTFSCHVTSLLPFYSVDIWITGLGLGPLLYIVCFFYWSVTDSEQVMCRLMAVNRCGGFFCLVYDDAAAAGSYFTPHLNLKAGDIVKQHEGLNYACYSLKKMHTYCGDSWILWAKRDEVQRKHVYYRSEWELSYWSRETRKEI